MNNNPFKWRLEKFNVDQPLIDWALYYFIELGFPCLACVFLYNGQIIGFFYLLFAIILEAKKPYEMA